MREKPGLLVMEKENGNLNRRKLNSLTLLAPLHKVIWKISKILKNIIEIAINNLHGRNESFSAEDLVMITNTKKALRYNLDILKIMF